MHISIKAISTFTVLVHARFNAYTTTAILTAHLLQKVALLPCFRLSMYIHLP